MVGTELAKKMRQNPIHAEPLVVLRTKLNFLLNLTANQVFTDRQFVDARDALIFPSHRRIISEVLGMGTVEHQINLAGPNASTVMPLSLLADESGDITDRLVAYLRPDPKMVIEVEKKAVGTEPTIYVYQVNIEDGRGGSWCEAFGSEEALCAFLRGIRVTYAMSDLQQLLPEFGDRPPLAFTEQSAVQTLP